MPPREREIVTRIRKLLTSAGAKVIKTSGQGEPDLIGTYQGFAFAIECKQPGKKPTALQVRRLSEWRRAGAIAFATDFPAKALQIVQVETETRLRDMARSVVFVEYAEPEDPPGMIEVEFMDGRPSIWISEDPEDIEHGTD